MSEFLNYLNTKPLYYKHIDHARIHKAYTLVESHIKHPKTIHIVGTNGKGSTGRTLAHLIFQSGQSVIHYSSPHILHFHERIWFNGTPSSDETLNKAHQKLWELLGQSVSDTLSYFEYSTLLALVVGESCDWIVLEAGLGGEFDATNVAPKCFSIITPIGLDHQDFLGENIEAIAATKINSIDTQALLAIGTPKKVKIIAQKIGTQKKAKLYDALELSSSLQQKKIRAFGFKGYLVDNIATALVAMDILQIPYTLEHLKTLQLFGRFYLLASNITLDVGHNPLSATQIVKSLGEKKIVLIYNTLEDKAYPEILSILKKNIHWVEIIPINTPRALKEELLQTALENLKIPYRSFETIEPTQEYLVYGSFYTVESFLHRYSPLEA